MFRDILAAVDGSPHADKALAHAIDLAEAEHARLTLMTAVALPAITYATMTAEMMATAQSDAETILRQARDRVPEHLPVTTVLTCDPIRGALLRQITAGRHDLVVMGSRGRGAVRSALLGSISHYVLNHSPVPVLIVHATRSPGDATERSRPALVAGRS